MMEFVWARPQDEDALLDFINLVFSVGGTPTDFRSLIPKVYGKGGFSANSLLARDAAGIKGVVSYTQGSLAMGNGELAYGFVGNVSAHPYLRGQGIMQT
ncbi:MAG TPA: GNAT family N-acetyltransferase, partial [Clostridia bacterium]|nr:GNAT family N-acetyltransferase [Clostridia bacterium]